MPAPPDFDRLVRDTRRLLQQLDLRIQQRVYTGNDSPEKVRTEFLPRYRRLDGQYAELARILQTQARSVGSPHNSAIQARHREVTRRRGELQSGFQGRLEGARRYHERQEWDRIESDLVRRRNDLLKDWLSRLPRQGVKWARSGMESGINKAVEAFLPNDLVQGEQAAAFRATKREISRILFQMAQEIPLVQDAFLFVERTLTAVSRFFHTRLSIHWSAVHLKREVERRGGADGQALKDTLKDAHRAWLASEREARISLKPVFKLKPKLTLDPANRFLEQLTVGAGVIVSSRDFRLEFGAEVEISDPLRFRRGSAVETRPEVRFRSGGFEAYVRSAHRYEHGAGSASWRHSVGAGARYSTDDGRWSLRGDYEYNPDTRHTFTFGIEGRF